MLQKAGVEPPFVLLGHSWGGLNARLFATQHPDQVAGLVLVDALNTDVLATNAPFNQVPFMFKVVISRHIEEQPLTNSSGVSDQDWLRGQKALVGISSNATFVMAQTDKHNIQFHEPNSLYVMCAKSWNPSVRRVLPGHPETRQDVDCYLRTDTEPTSPLRSVALSKRVIRAGAAASA